MENNLNITGLVVNIESNKILNGISLTVKPGEVHAIMGPNGSGKSTLAYALAGHPSYKIKAGGIKIGNKLLSTLCPCERSRSGLFLGFQNPISIPGVSLGNFLRTAKSARLRKKKLDLLAFQEELENTSDALRLNKAFLERPVNDGLSGGERKKSETLQLVSLGAKFAILDELDTGLDVDALKIISKVLKDEVEKGLGVILITHYCRILDYIKPDKVHILVKGKIVESGGFELAQRIEKDGYSNFD